MKPHEVSASIVVYKNDPGEVASAIKVFLSAPVKTNRPAVDHSPTPFLVRCAHESVERYIYAGRNSGFGPGQDVGMCRSFAAKYQTVLYPKVAITRGYTKGSHLSGKVRIYHLQTAVRHFGKWGWIYDSGRRRLNENPASITRGHATRESIA
jgi:hypothetical protein